MEEFKKMILKGEKNYNIIYLKDTYSLLNVEDKFYYIQINSYYHNTYKNYEITIFNKINYNAKRQADYTTGFNNLNELLTYILKTKNESFNNLKEAGNQSIFIELLTLKNGITLEQHLHNIAGSRENAILKDIDRIEEEESTKTHHILKFIDKNGKYFKINSKDWDRLIIG